MYILELYLYIVYVLCAATFFTPVADCIIQGDSCDKNGNRFRVVSYR
jgi:hypothetical protein